MKLVLNSNVIIAAFATHGICHSLLEHCLYNHTIFLSEDLLNEIRMKLQIRIKIPKKLVNDIISFLKNHARTVLPHSLEQAICTDPNLKNHARTVLPNSLEQTICTDPNVDNVISLAMITKSDYVISGDNDLLAPKRHKSIPILSPRGFWYILQKQDKEGLIKS